MSFSKITNLINVSNENQPLWTCIYTFLNTKSVLSEMSSNNQMNNLSKNNKEHTHLLDVLLLDMLPVKTVSCKIWKILWTCFLICLEHHLKVWIKLSLSLIHTIFSQVNIQQMVQYSQHLMQTLLDFHTDISLIRSFVYYHNFNLVLFLCISLVYLTHDVLYLIPLWLHINTFSNHTYQSTEPLTHIYSV